jgi:hypothetical protein
VGKPFGTPLAERMVPARPAGPNPRGAARVPRVTLCVNPQAPDATLVLVQ